MSVDRPIPSSQDWLLEKLKILVGEKLYDKEGTCFGYENAIAMAGINRNLAAAIKRLQWVHYGPPKREMHEYNSSVTREQFTREEFIKVAKTLTKDPKFGKMLDKKGNVLEEDTFENVFKGKESIAIDWILNGPPAGHSAVITAEELKSLIQIAQGLRADCARDLRENYGLNPTEVAEMLEYFDKEHPRLIYLINLQIFLENIVLFQAPENPEFAKLFEEGLKPTQKTISRDVIPLVAPIELDTKKEGEMTTRIKKLSDFSGLYSIDKYKIYYQTLFKHIKKNLGELRKELESKGKKLSELPFAISHHANRHCTGVLFNAETEKLIFVDANRAPPFEEGIDAIGQTTMDSFNFNRLENPMTQMESRIFIDSESSIMQKVLRDWQNDPEFKAIFETPFDLVINNLLGLVNERSISEEAKKVIDEIIKEYRENNEITLSSGNKQALELLLEAGFNPELNNSEGDTALLTAIRNGQVDIAASLLNTGVNPNNANSRTDETPLIAAVRKGNIEMVRMLLEHGADPNKIQHSGEEWSLPLHQTLLRSNTLSHAGEIVTLLLNAGANPERTNMLASGQPTGTAYQMAMTYGSGELMTIMEAHDRHCTDKLVALKAKIQGFSSINAKIETLKVAALKARNYFRLNQLIIDALLDAVTANDPTLVKLLLSTGIDPNQPIDQGETLLTTAARAGHKTIVEIALATPGTNVNKPNWHGVTPLMCVRENTEVVELLLNAGANVNLGVPHSVPLTGATNSVKRILLKAGAEINLPTEANPLFNAIRYDHHDAVQLLLTEGADPNLMIPIEDSNGKNILTTPFIYAIGEKNRSEILNTLIQHQNKLETFRRKLLPQVSTDPDFNTITQIVKTAKNYYSLRKNLLEYFKKSDTSQKVKELLQKALLFEGVNTNDLDLVKSMVSIGIDPNQTDELGETPLIIAAREGYKSLIEILLPIPGINVNKGNPWGVTPLIKASRKDVEIVKLLVSAGADVNLGSKYSTPLAGATSNVNLDAIRILIKAGANINVPGEGNPLFDAVRGDTHDAAQLLIAEGADPNFVVPVETSDGQTIPMSILDYARAYKNPSKVLEALESIAPAEVKARPPGPTDVHATLYSKHKAPSIDTEPNPTPIESATPKKDKH